MFIDLKDSQREETLIWRQFDFSCLEFLVEESQKEKAMIT